MRKIEANKKRKTNLFTLVTKVTVQKVQCGRRSKANNKTQVQLSAQKKNRWYQTWKDNLRDGWNKQKRWQHTVSTNKLKEKKRGNKINV